MKWVHRFFALLTIGPFILWGLLIAATIILAIGFDCRIDEGNIYPCEVMGRDIGRMANLIGFFASWGLMLFATFSMVMGMVWALVALIALIAKKL